MSEIPKPKTLLEAIRYFADQEVCVQFVADLRWPDGPVCPRCGSTEKHSYLTTRRIWKCKACKRQFSVKVGTIFEDSGLGFDKWLPAVWLVANSKNGISSHELSRALGITQKSAWFMLHRIRLAMQTGSFDKLGGPGGEVEVDETYVGGKVSNMHKDRRARQKTPRGGMGGKTAVLGMVERGGRVHAEVVGDAKRRTLAPRVRERIEPGSTVYTDALKSYYGLAADYEHAVIDHMESYVNGRVHTNGVENFWSLLKRGLHGTYVSVDPAHLFRYLDERVFTYNLRNLTDYERFAAVLRCVAGRRLTYAEVIGQR
jgi:transposase-like protein